MLTKYGKDSSITAMIDKMDWVIVPVSNVDGYVYTWNVRITIYNYLCCVSSFHYTLILNTIPPAFALNHYFYRQYYKSLSSTVIVTTLCFFRKIFSQLVNVSFTTENVNYRKIILIADSNNPGKFLVHYSPVYTAQTNPGSTPIKTNPRSTQLSSHGQKPKTRVNTNLGRTRVNFESAPAKG